MRGWNTNNSASNEMCKDQSVKKQSTFGCRYTSFKKCQSCATTCNLCATTWEVKEGAYARQRHHSLPARHTTLVHAPPRSCSSARFTPTKRPLVFRGLTPTQSHPNIWCDGIEKRQVCAEGGGRAKWLTSEMDKVAIFHLWRKPIVILSRVVLSLTSDTLTLPILLRITYTPIDRD